jgi:hypothetical protein
MRTFAALLNDEAGFIVSAELVLVATISVLALVVGLSEVAYAVNQELNDVSEAFGSLNQSFSFSGFRVCSSGCKESFAAGSFFRDHIDSCDQNECDIACCAPSPETPKGGGHGNGY